MFTAESQILVLVYLLILCQLNVYLDKVISIFEEVQNCFGEVREVLKRYPWLNYAFILMRCLVLYELGSDISVEAVGLQSLFFVTVFFLSTLSFSRAVDVLIAQCFWILFSHIFKDHFFGNIVMPMVMIWNEDFQRVLDGVLVTRIFQLLVQYGPVDQDILCIRVTNLFVMTWYTAFCSKSLVDPFFGGLIWYSYCALHPKLSVMSIVQLVNPFYKLNVAGVVLSCWFLLVFLRLK